MGAWLKLLVACTGVVLAVIALNAGLHDTVSPAARAAGSCAATSDRGTGGHDSSVDGSEPPPLPTWWLRPRPGVGVLVVDCVAEGGVRSGQPLAFRDSPSAGVPALAANTAATACSEYANAMPPTWWQHLRDARIELVMALPLPLDAVQVHAEVGHCSLSGECAGSGHSIPHTVQSWRPAQDLRRLVGSRLHARVPVHDVHVAVLPSAMAPEPPSEAEGGNTWDQQLRQAVLAHTFTSVAVARVGTVVHPHRLRDSMDEAAAVGGPAPSPCDPYTPLYLLTAARGATRQCPTTLQVCGAGNGGTTATAGLDADPLHESQASWVRLPPWVCSACSVVVGPHKCWCCSVHVWLGQVDALPMSDTM